MSTSTIALLIGILAVRGTLSDVAAPYRLPTKCEGEPYGYDTVN